MAEAGEIAAQVCAWVMLWGIHENESSLTAWAALIGNLLFFPMGNPCIGCSHSQSSFQLTGWLDEQSESNRVKLHFQFEATIQSEQAQSLHPTPI